MKSKRRKSKRASGHKASRLTRRRRPVEPSAPSASAPEPNMRYASGERLHIMYLVHCFYPESFTGTEKFVLQMAQAMQNRGHRVTVVTYSPSVPDDSPNAIGDVVFTEYVYEGIPVLAYRHRLLDPDSQFRIGDASLAALADYVLEREQPSVLHIGHPMRALEFAQAAQGRGIPYVITLTDFWTICPKSLLLRENRELCAGPEGGAACLAYCGIANVEERLASHLPVMQAASRLLSPSAFLAAMTSRVFPSLRIDVLHHGLRLETLVPNTKVYGKRSPLTLVYGGAISEHKGVHVLIEAMSMVPSAKLRLHIHGTGRPEYVAAMQAKASADPRISFHGPYAESELPHIYAKSDIAVVPSIWYENYPLALNEALASRVPAIVSDIGGMAEKVKDGVNGFTFQAGSAAHLARLIERLLRNPTLLNALKRNLRRMPVPTVEAEANAYESVYFAHAGQIAVA